MGKPNVLLICVDHWPGRYIGSLGHPTVLTPTIDELAATGVAFTNAYSTTPTCIPARRELFTGTMSRTHGDRVFNETLPMPDLPTLAQTYRDAGYQAYAVGKLHVYPQRDRIGFDDVILNEEGRHHLGLGADDYELFLTEQGFAGQELTHAMGNNDYCTRPWHLPEYCHPTNWTVREMCRTIIRRDPSRPAFWYMSFNHPHPPLAPLAEYMDLYHDIEIDMPYMGEWSEHDDELPYALAARRFGRDFYNDTALRLARKAFYALVTHIDHQIRLVVGTLREEGLLDNTIIMFTCDHGDMLGNHGLYAKATFYEDSARIPMVLVPTAEYGEAELLGTDDRLTTLADVMPTLLEMCGVPVPATVEGLSLLGERRRDYIYGEHWDDTFATRMVRNEQYKLIYYPVGNRTQLFDMSADTEELYDLADDPSHAEVRERLTRLLVKNLYGSDLEWMDGDELVGLPDIKWPHRGAPDKNLGGQRGWRFK